MLPGKKYTLKGSYLSQWNVRHANLATHISTWSKDPSTKVGAVLVDQRNIIVGLGYNGFPRGIDDAPERYADRTQKLPLVVHAELNAILNSNRADLRDCTLYTYPLMPCNECAKAIIQSGISTVISVAKDNPRFAESINVAAQMLHEANVNQYVIAYVEDEDYSYMGKVTYE